MYNQVRLQQGGMVLVCWIPVDKRVKHGVKLTLKDGPEGWWEVLEVYTTQKPVDQIRKTWKVGGL